MHSVKLILNKFVLIHVKTASNYNCTLVELQIKVS